MDVNDSFFSNCVLADYEHLRDCDCCNSLIDSKLLEESKGLDKEVLLDNDELLRKLKVIRSDIVKTVGNNNVVNGVKCAKEKALVSTILKNFEVFDLSIPTYALIVKSVINQALISYRLSNYLGSHGLTSISYDKFGNASEVVSPMIGISANVDKLIIDACEKMHKMKFGEKHVNENISNKPISLDELFKATKAEVIEQDDE
jgi:hypothetical protein